MGLPSLSIIIPTYNGIVHLQRCLKSVCQFAPVGAQVLVIDDASSDGTGAWLGQHLPNIEYHRLETNQGFCGAVNYGLAKARGDVVELLNNDTEVSAGWAEACLRHFADPSIGSMAPLVVQMEQPDLIDGAGQDYHICGWARNRRLGRKVEARDLVRQEVFGATGCCGFFRRSALEQVGGLWSIYGAYSEDTDLAFRLRWAGFRCIYEPASRVAHRGSASYGRRSERLVYLISRNEEIAYWANLPRSALLLGFIPHLGFLAVRMLRKTLARQAKTFLAGKISALGNWRRILEQRRWVRQLAANAGRKIDLSLTLDIDVLRQGIHMLLRGESA